MRKTLITTGLLLIIGLTACQGESQSAEPTEPSNDIGETGTVSGSNYCTSVSDPEAAAEQESPFPAVGEEDWAIGPEDATITIVEYGDFQ